MGSPFPFPFSLPRLLLLLVDDGAGWNAAATPGRLLLVAVGIWADRDGSISLTCGAAGMAACASICPSEASDGGFSVLVLVFVVVVAAVTADRRRGCQVEAGCTLREDRAGIRELGAALEAGRRRHWRDEVGVRRGRRDWIARDRIFSAAVARVRGRVGGKSEGEIVCGGFSVWRWCRERFQWRFFGEAWLELGPHASFWGNGIWTKLPGVDGKC